ncbi:copper chaperone PCu(A)C [Phaeovulum sp.]|uniref:copper chaperone PCu(A)C n=1 Tax=Phaeovulum sp. TaxID=2934796 RepID=UPI002AB81AAC|nr:copper chaperone PCu(A)C [Phaeovulum sp.]MDZ4120196.1 copper chaperone PCu(A)C [Phaeovulum sp.]
MSYFKPLLTALAVAFALPAAAQTITIDDAYARSSSMGATSGAAFFIIENKGTEADHLLSASSMIAERTELHTHIADANGVMQMVEVPEGWDIPAGGTHELKRGADHVMFLGLKQPLLQGDIVEVTLKFAKAGDVVVSIPVDLQRGAPASSMVMGGTAAPAMDHGTMAGGMGAAAPMAGMDHGAMMGGTPMAGMDHGAMMGGTPMGGMGHGAMMGGMGMAAPAAGNGLSAPVILLTPFVRDNADALNLNEAQRADLKAWLEKPNARAVVEGETVALRAELRAAIISGAPREARAALAEKIGANETRLVMFRSDCVDHWREVLSAEQFAQLLVLAGVVK